MSARRGHDEFYVGYLPQAPSGIGARTRLAVVLMLLVGLGVALALLKGQTPFAAGRFEFGVVRSFEGVVQVDPHPVLLVPRPGDDTHSASQYLLVAFGKFGAGDALRPLDGRAVRLEGSLIYRDGKTMIEIADGSVQPLEGADAERLRGLAAPVAEPVGTVTLVGEIVDSKCFWGVMKPGNLKPHRACATRCISGGIPPVFLVRDADGATRQFLLVGAAGEPVNDRILDRIAEPLEITGRVTRRGDLLILSADPDDYRCLGCAQPEVSSPTRRPNVLLIVADDLGYTDLGAFGGEIGTPNLDALAAEGTLLANFHAASTCSPSRAMLLSGVDNHLAGLGTMAGDHSPNQADAPGYETYLNFDVAALPEVLRDAGYHTYMSGKWHLGMTEDTSPAARGFERSFGLMNGGAGHFDDLPMFHGGRVMFREGRDEVPVPEDFYSTRDYAKKMIEYIDEGRGDDRPFFAYLAFTAPHWPLQAPDDSIAAFAGRYDDGYDVLRARRLENLQRLGLIAPEVEPASAKPDRRPWDALTADQQRFEARRMEVYAAMVRDLDTYVGRVIDHLKRIGEYDRTLVLFLSDNGAEGHDLLDTWPHLAGHLDACCDNSLENLGRGNSYVWPGREWARASIGAFDLYKGFVTEGGIRVPAIAKLPGEGGEAAVSHAFASVLDVMPTILELAGAEAPSQRNGRPLHPLQGRSMLAHLRGDAATVHGPDPEMGWELFGRRAIRRGDWKLTYTTPPQGPGRWQLFDLADDPAEQVDRFEAEPERREELLALWDDYVRRNGVILPDAPSAY